MNRQIWAFTVSTDGRSYRLGVPEWPKQFDLFQHSSRHKNQHIFMHAYVLPGVGKKKKPLVHTRQTMDFYVLEQVINFNTLYHNFFQQHMTKRSFSDLDILTYFVLYLSKPYMKSTATNLSCMSSYSIQLFTVGLRIS